MAPTRSELPHDFPDRAVRDAVVEPHNLRDLLQRVLPVLVEHLDFSSVEEVPRTFLLDDWRRREADVLLRLRFRDQAWGRELLVCLLLEHQSTADPAMPLRLLLYAVLFWEQQWKEWQEEHERGVPLRLTPVLPLVLHTGAEPWDSNRRFADLFDVPAALVAYIPQWHTSLCDLVELPLEELLGGDEALWNALAVVWPSAPRPRSLSRCCGGRCNGWSGSASRSRCAGSSC